MPTGCAYECGYSLIKAGIGTSDVLESEVLEPLGWATQRVPFSRHTTQSRLFTTHETLLRFRSSRRRPSGSSKRSVHRLRDSSLRRVADD